MCNANPNDNYNKLNTIIMDSLSKHLPKKVTKFQKQKHRKSKWITQGIVKSIANRDKMHIKLRSIDENNPNYNTLKVNLKTYNTILRKSISLAKKSY